MPLVGSNLIRLLNAGESGNVAAYSALLAVDKKFDVIAVLKLVRVSCLLQRLLRIIVYAELKRSGQRFESESAIPHFDKASIAMVSVFLRNKIIMLEIRNYSRVYAKLSRRLSVAVVFGPLPKNLTLSEQSSPILKP